MKKAEREAYVYTRAEELAGTGQFRNWLSIEHAIRAEGFTEARRVLDDAYTRKQLNQICARHWKGYGDDA